MLIKLYATHNGWAPSHFFTQLWRFVLLYSCQKCLFLCRVDAKHAYSAYYFAKVAVHIVLWATHIFPVFCLLTKKMLVIYIYMFILPRRSSYIIMYEYMEQEQCHILLFQASSWLGIWKHLAVKLMIGRTQLFYFAQNCTLNSHPLPCHDITLEPCSCIPLSVSPLPLCLVHDTKCLRS